MNKSYNKFAVFLHWSIAICVLMLLCSGFSLHYELWDSQQFVFQLYQLHKSIGVTVLCLVVLRIAWRLINKPPELPQALIKKQKLIHFGHIGLYLLLALLPISGWVLVSTSPEGIPTIVFGLLNWLHLPVDDAFHEPAKFIHHYGAWLILIMIAGHFVMAVIHQKSGVELLQRMRTKPVVKVSLLATFSLIALLSVNVFSSQPTSQVKSLNSTETDGGSNAQNNRIVFSGLHVGNEFQGEFTQWSLDTDIDFTMQTMTVFDLEVQVSSLTTGSDLYDKTLVETDWFNLKNFPVATFVANEATFLSESANSESSAIVEGSLKIKETTIPLQLNLVYDAENLTTEFILKRKDINLGQNSDPDGEWVSEEIQVSARVSLTQ